MIEQLELAEVKKPAPAVSTDEVARVIEVLRRGKEWMTAKEIALALGVQPTPSQERRIRAAASVAMPAIVSYPGSPGYRLWSACSVAEIQHAIAAFETQGKEMIKRGVLYRRAYHAGHRGPAVEVNQSTLPWM